MVVIKKQHSNARSCVSFVLVASEPPQMKDDSILSMFSCSSDFLHKSFEKVSKESLSLTVISKS